MPRVRARQSVFGRVSLDAHTVLVVSDKPGLDAFCAAAAGAAAGGGAAATHAPASAAGGGAAPVVSPGVGLGRAGGGGSAAALGAAVALPLHPPLSALRNAKTQEERVEVYWGAARRRAARGTRDFLEVVDGSSFKTTCVALVESEADRLALVGDKGGTERGADDGARAREARALALVPSFRRKTLYGIHALAAARLESLGGANGRPASVDAWIAPDQAEGEQLRREVCHVLKHSPVFAQPSCIASFPVPRWLELAVRRLVEQDLPGREWQAQVLASVFEYFACNQDAWQKAKDALLATIKLHMPTPLSAKRVREIELQGAHAAACGKKLRRAREEFNRGVKSSLEAQQKLEARQEPVATAFASQCAQPLYDVFAGVRTCEMDYWKAVLETEEVVRRSLSEMRQKAERVTAAQWVEAVAAENRAAGIELLECTVRAVLPGQGLDCSVGSIEGLRAKLLALWAEETAPGPASLQRRELLKTGHLLGVATHPTLRLEIDGRSSGRKSLIM